MKKIQINLNPWMLFALAFLTVLASALFRTLIPVVIIACISLVIVTTWMLLQLCPKGDFSAFRWICLGYTLIIMFGFFTNTTFDESVSKNIYFALPTWCIPLITLYVLKRKKINLIIKITELPFIEYN